MTTDFTNLEKIISPLSSGAVGVMPTDTIYGLVGPALSEQAVERIYKIKNRDSGKPCIVLISSADELERFNISFNERLVGILNGLWPTLAHTSPRLRATQQGFGRQAGAVSVIVPCDSESHRYIHRGKGSIAFRVPEPEWLRDLLSDVGPLVAPSANIAGRPPAENIDEAKDYFGDEVDFYVDKGELSGEPSVLLEVKRF